MNRLKSEKFVSALPAKNTPLIHEFRAAEIPFRQGINQQGGKQ